jgi:hypothetical protein
VFVFGYTEVDYRSTHFLHGLVYEVVRGLGVLVWHRDKDLVVDLPHDLQPGDLRAPLVDRDSAFVCQLLSLRPPLP